MDGTVHHSGLVFLELAFPARNVSGCPVTAVRGRWST